MSTGLREKRTSWLRASSWKYSSIAAGYGLSLLIAFCLFAGAPTAAGAQTQSFDPSMCPGGGNGKLTVRLVSGLALQLPASGFMLRDAMPDPRDPSLPPYGCPENPVITRGFYLPYRYEALLANKYDPDLPLGRPDQLLIIGHDGPTMGQDNALKAFERAKRQFSACEFTSEGLEVCRNCAIEGDWCHQVPGRSDRTSKIGIPAWLRAPDGLYAEYKGRPFIVDCTWAFPADTQAPRNRECSVRYELTEGLSVSYRFTDPEVGEDHFLAYDRAIRQQIMDMRVPALDRPPTWDLVPGSVGWIRTDQLK